jgi:hypothetical protein
MPSLSPIARRSTARAAYLGLVTTRVSCACPPMPSKKEPMLGRPFLTPTVASGERAAPMCGCPTRRLASGRGQEVPRRCKALEEAGWVVIRQRGCMRSGPDPARTRESLWRVRMETWCPWARSLAFAELAVWSICGERIRSHLRTSRGRRVGRVSARPPRRGCPRRDAQQVAGGIQEALDTYAEMRSLCKQLPAPAASASTLQAA